MKLRAWGTRNRVPYTVISYTYLTLVYPDMQSFVPQQSSGRIAKKKKILKRRMRGDALNVKYIFLTF